MEPLARAYIGTFGGQALVPLETPGTSQVLTQARMITDELLPELGDGPLIVHGVHTGSISAVQVAAEFSQPRQKPRCCNLVLENGITSIDMIPGVLRAIGSVQNDPLGQALKLKLVRCPITLVRGKGEWKPSYHTGP